MNWFGFKDGKRVAVDSIKGMCIHRGCQEIIDLYPDRHPYCEAHTKVSDKFPTKPFFCLSFQCDGRTEDYNGGYTYCDKCKDIYNKNIYRILDNLMERIEDLESKFTGPKKTSSELSKDEYSYLELLTKENQIKISQSIGNICLEFTKKHKGSYHIFNNVKEACIFIRGYMMGQVSDK